MTSANISTLRNKLTFLLRKVRAGEDIIVLDRDRPIAKISPIGDQRFGGAGDDENFLSDLERRGVIRRATRKLPRPEMVQRLRKNLAKPRGGIEPVKVLLEEREEGY